MGGSPKNIFKNTSIVAPGAPSATLHHLQHLTACFAGGATLKAVSESPGAARLVYFILYKKTDYYAGLFCVIQDDAGTFCAI